MKRKNWIRSAIATVFLTGIALFFLFEVYQYFSLEELRTRRDALLAFTEANLVLMIALYMAVYIVMAGLSVPGAAVMTLAGGALFGLLIGTLAVSFASTLGATLVFLAARFLFRDAVQQRFGKRLATINRGIERDGAFYLLALRLVPAFPFFVINLVMALTPIRTWTYYWVSQVGMLPATIVYVNAGTQLARVDTVGDILSPQLIGAFVLLGLLPLLLRWTLRFLERRKVYRGFCKPASFDYNLAVIGAGSAGLVSAYIASAVRAKVALIEKDRMGGDCLNTGCVPSKALLRTARLLAEARDSRRFGVRKMEAEFDFAEVMDRVRDVIATIEPHDSRERYEGLGVDVIEGEARLVSPWEVEVGGRRIRARSLVLATGARPLVPAIPGLEVVDYLTSNNLWDLREQPRRLVVLGGGPIGCELAQAFARLGSKVTIVEMLERILPREDAEAGELLARHLALEGVHVAPSHKAVRVEAGGKDTGGRLMCEHQGREVGFDFDRLLVALGRKANVEDFGLEDLGVALSKRGTVAADGFQRTNFPNIFTCGDATSAYQFTHVASHQAWSATVNALIASLWSFRTDYSAIPWCTFTDPEVARVGLSEDEARAAGTGHEITHYDLEELDRAVTDGTAYGFVKVLTRPGSDRILGATVAGPHAGELITEFTLAMRHGLGLNKLLGTIHVYPTLMEANKFAAGAWKRAHAPDKALEWAERFFRWRRGRNSETAQAAE